VRHGFDGISFFRFRQEKSYFQSSIMDLQG